jgi:hypothetical protein
MADQLSCAPAESSSSDFASLRPAHSALYRDALTSVLSFLSLHELAAALSVSKEWAAAVLSMRPAMLTADISSEVLAELLSSPLRRHVGGIGPMDQPGGINLWLSPSNLPMLARALPQLRWLHAGVDLEAGDSVPLECEFPARLEHLCFSLDEWDSSPNAQRNATALLASIGQLQQLHSLRLHMDQTEADASFGVLRRLPLLRDLHLSVPVASMRQFAAEMRAFSLLHRLYLDAPRTEGGLPRAALFIALLRDAPEEELRTLQWRDFCIDGLDFTDELTPLLCRLPSLERLACHFTQCTQFDFLAALPRLTSLEASLTGVKEAGWTKLLGIFTSDRLTLLHTLHLYGGPSSGDDLVQLLSHTPSLTSLLLGGLTAVSSLSFFHELPQLAQSLISLTVQCGKWNLTAADLPSLLALRQLRELRLLNWSGLEPDMLTVEDRAPFEQRPCAVLPHLELFQWTKRKYIRMALDIDATGNPCNYVSL